MDTPSNTQSPDGFGDPPLGSPNPTTQRVLVIGLDGVTFDILDPLMEAGKMPRLRAAIARGVSGVLHSTTPPITPAAWTTFLTGKQPGTHGIIDFERYDPITNKLSFNTTGCLGHVRNIWQILGEHGLKVGSVNVPMTHPPVPVNGFLVSGFETPGTDVDFVYPPDLRDEILQRWPDPTLGTNWQRRTFGGNALFARNIDYMCRSFHQGADMSRWLGDRMGWDALMVVLKLTDNLQHKTWKHLDPRWSDRNPVRRDMAVHGFIEADKAVGTLLDYAAEHDAAVLIVSDHGHGSKEGSVHPNAFLERWGYLALRGRSAQGATRGRYLWDRLWGRTRKFAREGDVLQDLAVDFSRTKACVMHAGMAGFVYVNLKGRQPTGIVEPEDYEEIRDELIARFLGDECRTRDPQGNLVHLFTAAHKPEALYGCRREDQPWLPDLILMPHAPLEVKRKIRRQGPVRWLPYGRIEGTHRPEGVFVATGQGIRKRPMPSTGVRTDDVSAHLVDCAPTILALLGLAVPEDMEGRVLTEIFETVPEIRTEAAASVEAASSVDEVYSAEQLQRVTERLSDLGYLE